MELPLLTLFFRAWKAGDPGALHPTKARVNCQAQLSSKCLGNYSLLSQVDGLPQDWYFLTTEVGRREGAKTAILCAVSRR